MSEACCHTRPRGQNRASNTRCQNRVASHSGHTGTASEPSIANCSSENHAQKADPRQELVVTVARAEGRPGRSGGPSPRKHAALLDAPCQRRLERVAPLAAHGRNAHSTSETRRVRRALRKSMRTLTRIM
eukprot:3777519-Rhodomonas_salina.4